MAQTGAAGGDGGTGGTAAGGGIYVAGGQVIVAGSTFSQNQAIGGAGGIGGTGGVGGLHKLGGAAGAGGPAGAGAGGALYLSQGSLTVTTSVLENNSAPGEVAEHRPPATSAPRKAVFENALVDDGRFAKIKRPLAEPGPAERLIFRRKRLTGDDERTRKQLRAGRCRREGRLRRPGRGRIPDERLDWIDSGRIRIWHHPSRWQS